MSNNNNIRGTIFSKVLFSIFLAIALPLFGLWYFGNYQFQKEIDNKVNNHFSHIVDELATQIDGWKEMNVRLLRQNSQLAAIHSGNHVQQSPVLVSISDTYEWIYLAYTVGDDGYMSGRSDAKNRPIYNDDGSKAHFRGDREYHKAIMSGEGFSEELLISRTLGKPAFILCTKNQHPDTARLQGSLCIAMTVIAMSEAVTNVSVGSTGHAILLDKDNRVIAHGDPKVLSNNLQDMSDTPLVTHSVEGQPYVFIDTQGKKKIAYHKVTLEGWKLFVEQEYDDAFSPLANAQQYALLFFLVTIIISVSIAFLMARRLAKPIKKITLVANNISRGEYHTKLNDNLGNDEIGDLQEAVERMRKTIQIAMDRLRQS